jgi:hypothetical protein
MKSRHWQPRDLGGGHDSIIPNADTQIGTGGSDWRRRAARRLRPAWTLEKQITFVGGLRQCGMTAPFVLERGSRACLLASYP